MSDGSAAETPNKSDGTELFDAVQRLVSMVQFLAKNAERSDRARDQAFLDLRAHLTSETERLGVSLRGDVARAAGLDVFATLLPTLDEIDEVLSVQAARAEPVPGMRALAALRRRLVEAFGRLGIQEIPVTPGTTAFDPAEHEAEASGEATPGVAPGTVLAVRRAGYRSGDQLIRASLVTIAQETP